MPDPVGIRTCMQRHGPKYCVDLSSLRNHWFLGLNLGPKGVLEYSVYFK